MVTFTQENFDPELLRAFYAKQLKALAQLLRRIPKEQIERELREMEEVLRELQ